MLSFTAISAYLNEWQHLSTARSCKNKARFIFARLDATNDVWPF